MFMSHDHSPAKKAFQKPNILRRKPKVASIRPCKSSEAQKISSSGNLKPDELYMNKTECSAVELKGPTQVLTLDINVEPAVENLEENAISISQGDYDGLGSSIQSVVNVEAFLNSEQSTQNEPQNKSLEEKFEIEPKWHIDFLDDSDKIIIEPYDGTQVFMEEKGSSATDMVTATPMTSVHETAVEGIQHVSIEHYTPRTLKFKCDAPNCNKQFMSEQKLKRHKNVHNKDKAPRHTTTECPVRKTEDGVEKPCGRIFLVREELLKHLNEDHTLDDAPHKCEECGRQFFWAPGLRAHARAHRARRRAPLACGWPGCGRAFRQPCRLREHARAHTGDKPYPCPHPVSPEVLTVTWPLAACCQPCHTNLPSVLLPLYQTQNMRHFISKPPSCGHSNFRTITLDKLIN